MNKIGTHNSLSYPLPQWWLVPFFWVARCQKKNIEEQYNMGVRYFDIRPKISNGKIVAGHGLATYNIDMDKIWTFLNEKKDCIVRIFCESGDTNTYISYIKEIMSKYPNIQYTGGYQRYKGKIVNLPDIEEDRYYWEKSPNTKFCIPFPQLYALLNNYKNRDKINSNTYSVFDFIELSIK